MRVPFSLLPYTMALWALLPMAMLLLYRRLGTAGAAGARWKERFGLIAVADATVEYWIHASSLGEVQAASPLIEALLMRCGDRHVAVTTTTATGSAQVIKRWGGRVQHGYLPFDIGWFVDRFLARLQPRRAVIMESELWPNLFAHLRRRGVPIVIANARMSPRSQRRYRRVPKLVGETLSCCTCVAAQSAPDAQRFLEFGARRVEICGNLKFDCAVPPEQLESGRALRNQLGTQRPVWVAVSTHDTEEKAALDAHLLVLDEHPQAVLMIVPRHPQRFEEVSDLLQAQPLRVARRSGHDADADTQVLLGDSVGEMFAYLAAADVAFVGGSLIPHGGQNIIEPAAAGLPVLFGPSMHNFAVPRDLLRAAGVALEIADAKALGVSVTRLLSDTALRRDIATRAREALSEHTGATDRVLKILEALPVKQPG